MDCSSYTKFFYESELKSSQVLGIGEELKKNMFLRNKKNDLSTEKTIELEKALSESALAQIGYMKQDEELAKQFGLEICINDNLPDDVEAVLDKTDSPDYKGIIQIKRKYKNNSFSFIHEIIHYVFDVRPGNRVEKQYARNVKGKTKDQREQEINYLTAAYQLPYTKMIGELRSFNKQYPRDELRFVAKLCNEYKQPREAVLRRIREVKRIAAAKNERI